MSCFGSLIHSRCAVPDHSFTAGAHHRVTPSQQVLCTGPLHHSRCAVPGQSLTAGVLYQVTPTQQVSFNGLLPHRCAVPDHYHRSSTASMHSLAAYTQQPLQVYTSKSETTSIQPCVKAGKNIVERFHFAVMPRRSWLFGPSVIPQQQNRPEAVALPFCS